MFQHGPSRSSNKKPRFNRKSSNLEPECSHQQDSLPFLPLEMIIKIISKLTSAVDIRNCLLISKEIRHSILVSPEIMRNIKAQFNCFHESEKAAKFLKEHGKHIQCLNILSRVDSPKIFKDLLSLVPNLEEFILDKKIVPYKSKYPWSVVYSDELSEDDSDTSESEEEEIVNEDIDNFMDDDYVSPPNKQLNDFWNENKDSVDMIKLKELKIDVRDLQFFLKATKNVISLKKLIIFSHGPTYDDFLFDFICKQDNLKELSVINQKDYYIEFPMSNPISRFKFRLKKFKLVITNNLENNDFFTKFININANTLEELEVDHSLSLQSLCSVFHKCRNLLKFSLKSDKFSLIYSMHNTSWVLPSLKHFEDQNSYGLNLNIVLNKFPNIESLKCQVITDSSKIPNKIKILEVNSMHATCFFREEIMRNTLMHVKNVEHLVIQDARNTQILSRIIKHLDVMENLKTFSFRINPTTKWVFNKADEEEDPANHMYYKIMADLRTKIVKVSTYIVRQDEELLDALINTFRGFEFYEFCLDESKIQKIDIGSDDSEY